MRRGCCGIRRPFRTVSSRSIILESPCKRPTKTMKSTSKRLLKSALSSIKYSHSLPRKKTAAMPFNNYAKFKSANNLLKILRCLGKKGKKAICKYWPRCCPCWWKITRATWTRGDSRGFNLWRGRLNCRNQLSSKRIEAKHRRVKVYNL